MEKHAIFDRTIMSDTIEFRYLYALEPPLQYFNYETVVPQFVTVDYIVIHIDTDYYGTGRVLTTIWRSNQFGHCITDEHMPVITSYDEWNGIRDVLAQLGYEIYVEFE